MTTPSLSCPDATASCAAVALAVMVASDAEDLTPSSSAGSNAAAPRSWAKTRAAAASTGG